MSFTRRDLERQADAQHELPASDLPFALDFFFTADSDDVSDDTIDGGRRYVEYTVKLIGSCLGDLALTREQTLLALGIYGEVIVEQAEASEAERYRLDSAA